MEASLAVQIALRARLVATPAVTARVPATAILDRNERPAPAPSIIIGEAQEVDDGDDLARRRVRVFHTVHVWHREVSLEQVTRTLGAIRRAVGSGRLILDGGWHCAGVKVANARTMRDPGGEMGHGVMTIEALAQEA